MGNLGGLQSKSLVSCSVSSQDWWGRSHAALPSETLETIDVIAPPSCFRAAALLSPTPILLDLVSSPPTAPGSSCSQHFTIPMGRQEKIARSIVRAITNGSGAKRRSGNPLALLLALFSALFTLYQLALRKVRPADFANLRRKHWDVCDDAYVKSFQPDEGETNDEPLKSIGDMGFSGSVRHTKPPGCFSPLGAANLRYSRPSIPPPIRSISSSLSPAIPSTPSSPRTF